MKEIFQSVIGMTISIGLFLVLNAMIESYVPDLELLASAARGFLYITLFMGFLIVSKSGFELIYASCTKK